MLQFIRQVLQRHIAILPGFVLLEEGDGSALDNGRHTYKHFRSSLRFHVDR